MINRSLLLNKTPAEEADFYSLDFLMSLEEVVYDNLEIERIIDRLDFDSSLTDLITTEL